jgi:hypothetical protein
MHTIASEILINSRQVTRESLGEPYEFILNSELKVIECVQIESIPQGKIRPVPNTAYALEGMLFELNHVRVNPKMDNTFIIRCLTGALHEIGVEVLNPPPRDSMAVCFRPLGEISANVRFYLNQDSKLIFLSPAVRPRLVCSNT